MKFPLLSFIFIFCIAKLYSQTSTSSINNGQFSTKPTVDFSAIEHWPSLGRSTFKEVEISNSGNFFVYELMNVPVNGSTLVIEAINNSWKQEFPNAKQGHFTDDNAHYLFNVNDSLGILSIGDKHTLYLDNVISWRQPKANTNQWLAYLTKNKSSLILRHMPTGREQHFDSTQNYAFDERGRWLALQLNTVRHEVILCNLLTGKQQSFQDAISYSLSKEGDVLLLQTKVSTDGNDRIQLQWLNLANNNVKTIYEGNNTGITGVAMDDSGKQITFAVHEDSQPDFNSIWYYNVAMPQAIKRVDALSAGISAGFQIYGTPGFTANGRYITFSLLKERDKRAIPENAANINVWSYADTILQPTQISHLSRPERGSYAVVGVNSGQVVMLSSDYEKILTISEDYAIVQRDVAGDQFWKSNYKKDSIWLISFKDGSKKYLDTRAPIFMFSPGGKYAIGFDIDQGSNYFSYNLITGERINITSTIPVRLGGEDEYSLPHPRAMNFLAEIPAWILGDEAALIYDGYDIWQVDLAGKKAPVNITNGYGRSHNIKFRLTRDNNAGVLNSTDHLLLTAYNIKSKQNGFFRKKLDRSGDPELLYMGPYIFDLNGIGFTTGNAHHFNLNGRAGMPPKKANGKDIWIVKRENATEAPNYYLTKDFKHYKQLTFLAPQQKYNWLTSELISFKQLDGTTSQGILYKPENFDSTKKYPLLITYYKQLSHRLYQYPTPYRVDEGTVQVSWFVSRGYLVFTPDIYFTPGARSVSGLNTVVGAAEYLAQFPFVDRQKMGIAGHSMAGGLTNYILTHTNIFAAVFEGAGGSDAISGTISLTGEPTDNTSRYDADNEEGRGTLWSNPKSWLDQSPIMTADKVSSPLLIFHCKNDWALPFHQAVELFLALRRLEKRVWLLEYDEEGHALDNVANQKDLTIRVTQFFDHYLKDELPPRWMTHGIPAKAKKLEHGYELDSISNCGESCLICDMRKQKKDN
ncbi:S9 family peptidase [Chitinophaga sp. S165]|uniref:alpha/beta hydrolase family protein n=1 Tax=Chitinophaga sp. S165 TaxID=2135462 RepID=UPI000D70A564|nr:prolyl oligopeptidase family serine peptidase [Chitinophaga sp. S165]PWV55550.1 prolyl oligopeptidase family protein [Chitinophaga sp. S165]